MDIQVRPVKGLIQNLEPGVSEVSNPEDTIPHSIEVGQDETKLPPKRVDEVHKIFAYICNGVEYEIHKVFIIETCTFP
jgi:hypothetical protein